MYNCIHIYIYIIYVYMERTDGVIPASVKRHPFSASLRPAIRQRKLLSSPRFGALKANIPMYIIFQSRVFSQTLVVKGVMANLAA